MGNDKSATIINQFRDLAEKCFKSKRNAFLIFSDISGSTKEAVQDELRYIAKSFEHIIHSCMPPLSTDTRHVVKTVGDEVMLTQVISLTDTENEDNMAEFAKEIINSAITFQRDVKYGQVGTKMAIHYCRDVVSGDVLREKANDILEKFTPHDGDLFGKDVNFGARMMSVAKEGDILISKEVFDLLPDEMKQAAKEQKEITLSTENVISFDVPMLFHFKGFDKSDTEMTFNAVIQIKHDKNKQPLSYVGYEFRCLTFFKLSNATENNIRVLIDNIYSMFPGRSVPFIFQLIKDTKHDGEEFHYEVGMLTQLQNYDTYAKLYNMLKTKAGKLISSSFTNPLWDGNKNRFNDISGKKRMLLLRTNGSESTDRIHAMTNTEPLSIVVLGYYDNIIISDSIKKAKKFLASFDSYLKKDKHDSKAFNIMVIPYKSLYKWEN